jgi:hypothetical protein
MKSVSGSRLLFCLVFGAAALATGLSPAAAEIPFFDFAGYSYLDGPAWQVGTRVTLVARFNPIQPNPIWPVDLEANEYTVLAEGLEIVSAVSDGGFVEVAFGGGTLAIFRDGARNSSYSPAPPNAEVPATFADGATELSGAFTELVLLFDQGTGIGTVSGFVDWTGGEKLPILSDPNHWTFFGGVSDHSGLGIPPGYDLAWDPQIYGPETPVPVVEQSWGALKARYRR